MLLMQVAFIFVLLHKSQALQCVDHNNNPVDWYVINKLPQESASNNPLIAQGAAYVYLTSSDPDGWKLSTISVNNSSSLLGLVLQPFYSSTPGNLHVIYNDETPDGSVNFKKGHTKGLVLGDANGGLWLVHSVPRFPPVSGTYYYPHNGLIYGQSALCISLDKDNLDKVGLQLQYNMPHVYSQNMPDNLKALFPKLTEVMNDVTVKSAPWYHLEMLKSAAGVMFLSFAKGPKFAKELYIDWVAPTLSSNLLVETWLNGPGRIPSECDPYFNVSNVNTLTVNVANVTYKDTSDHSKWAVAETNSKWICIGDINRATPQRSRGGGTVCFSNGTVAKAYQSIITSTEPC